MNKNDPYWQLREMAVSARTSVAEICRIAGINSSTVWRWKAGTQPNMRTWSRLLDAIEQIRQRGQA
ncbi:MAG: hypothetical protein ACOVKN_02360 [Arenimonas sp.]